MESTRAFFMSREAGPDPRNLLPEPRGERIGFEPVGVVLRIVTSECPCLFGTASSFYFIPGPMRISKGNNKLE